MSQRAEGLARLSHLSVNTISAHPPAAKCQVSGAILLMVGWKNREVIHLIEGYTASK